MFTVVTVNLGRRKKPRNIQNNMKSIFTLEREIYETVENVARISLDEKLTLKMLCFGKDDNKTLINGFRPPPRYSLILLISWDKRRKK